MAPHAAPKSIGVISDTHGLVRDEALIALVGSACILHAGDIGKPDVVEQLEQIAPVHAIRGNVDTGTWARAFPSTRTVNALGLRIFMIHDVNSMDQSARSDDVDVVVSGHSHSPSITYHSGVLYLNPGSAGPRRFRLPICVAQLQITTTGVAADIVHLDV